MMEKIFRMKFDEKPNKLEESISNETAKLKNMPSFTKQDNH